MNRRCKIGQRARFVSSTSNAGKVVVIARPYYGELIEGAQWPRAVVFPWIVISLGGPLASVYADTGKAAPLSSTIVCEDQDLEPLDDDDDGLTTSNAVARCRPKAIISSTKKAQPVSEPAP